jgi:hypothetical protein
MNALVGTSTLPPRWPHFFSEASWSSKWIPAAPASIVGVERPAEAGLGVGHDRHQQRPRRPAVDPLDLLGPQQRVVDPADQRRDAVGRVQALVGVDLLGQVGVGRDLPAGQVDGLQAGLDHLHRLAAGERAERRQVVPLGEQRPQPLRAVPGQGVLRLDHGPQPQHLLGAVVAPDPPPARVGGPFLRQTFGRLLGHGGQHLRRVRERDAASLSCKAARHGRRAAGAGALAWSQFLQRFAQARP